MQETRTYLLFEDMQEQLERSADILTELIEKPVHQLDKDKIINMTSVTNTIMKNMLLSTEDGFMCDNTI